MAIKKKKVVKKDDKKLLTIKLKKNNRHIELEIQKNKILMDWIKSINAGVKVESNAFGQNNNALEFYDISGTGYNLGNIREKVFESYSNRINLAVLRTVEEKIFIKEIVPPDQIKNCLTGFVNDVKKIYINYIRPLKIEAVINIKEE